MNDECLIFTAKGSYDLSNYHLLKKGITYNMKIMDVNKLISIIDKQAYPKDYCDVWEYRKGLFQEWNQYVLKEIERYKTVPEDKYNSETKKDYKHLLKVQEKLKAVLERYES